MGLKTIVCVAPGHTDTIHEDFHSQEAKKKSKKIINAHKFVI
jgi:hypothetical protein